MKVEHTISGSILTGYNTDILGFRESLLEFIQTPPTQALLLGTGGASKAVRNALTSLGIEVFTVSRTPHSSSEISYNQVARYLPNTPLIINATTVGTRLDVSHDAATPVGMWPHITDCPDIPYHLLSSNHYLFDLIYNPEITEFMHRGEQQGARIKNGLQMLYLQADYSWKLWTT